MRNREPILAFVLMAISGACFCALIGRNGWVLLGYFLGIIQAIGSAVICKGEDDDPRMQ